MTIDQQIYHLLLNNAGGVQNNIKGINKMLLNKMRKGTGKTKFSQLLEAMFENGIDRVTLHSEHTLMNIEVKDKSIEVLTKAIQ